MNKQKSYKREVAFCVLVYILLMGAGFIGSYEALELMIWPAMFFVGGAFGLEGFRQIAKEKMGVNPTT